LRQRWHGELQRQNDQKPKRRPVAAALCCFGKLTCLNVQLGFSVLSPRSVAA